MKFLIPIDPPTATAQEKKIAVVGGKPRTYDPPKVKAAKRLLTHYLMVNRPKRPFEGPLELTVFWLFAAKRPHKDLEWRTTRPDTDNLEKALKDCMTKCGFWKDDAQVVREIVEKRWSKHPVGIFIEVKTLEEHK